MPKINLSDFDQIPTEPSKGQDPDEIDLSEFDQIDSSPAELEAEPQETTTISHTMNVNLAKELDYSPENEAHIYKTSQHFGIPIDFARDAGLIIEDDVPETAITKSPALQSYLGKSVNNAAISQGDYESLSGIEKLWTKTKQAYKGGWQNVELGKLRSRQLLGDESPELESRIIEYKKTFSKPIPDENFFEKIVTGAAEQAPLLINSMIQGNAGGMRGAITFGTGTFIAGQMGPQAGLPEEIITVPLAAGVGYSVGAANAAVKGMFDLEAGLAYDEFLELRDENNNPIDKNILKVAAAGVGTINAALEFISLKALLKTIPGSDRLIAPLTVEPIKQLLKRRGVIEALAPVAAKYLGAITTESITEMGQEAATILGGEFAKAVSESTEGTRFADMDTPQAVQRVLEAGIEAAAATIGTGFLGTAAGTVKAIHNSNQSQKFQDNLSKINDAVNNSKTKELSPDHMEKFLDMAGIGEEVFISPEGIETLYQTDPDQAENILERLDVDPKTAKGSASLGVSVSVKLSKVHAQLSVEEFNGLKQDLKPAPGAYSGRELANNDVVVDMDQLSAQYSEAIKDQEGFEIEAGRIKEQIQKTGFDAEYAGEVVDLLGRFADRMALEGVDRVEFLKKIEIGKKKLKQGEPVQVFYQAGSPGTSPLGFFSGVQREVEAIDFKNMPARDLANRIKKTQGLKQEEIDHLGLTDWLEGMGKNKVSKEQVTAFVEAGGVQLDEVVKGENVNQEIKQARQTFKNELIKTGFDSGAADRFISEFDAGEISDAQLKSEFETNPDGLVAAYAYDKIDTRSIAEYEDNKPKFKGYVLPGGENYREVLLTLPVERKQTFDDFLKQHKERFPGNTISNDVLRRAFDQGFTIPGTETLVSKPTPEFFKSSHFDEPNILAHVRLNDRVDSEGRKTLFVEEIQSDWHQAGRKKGYRGWLTADEDAELNRLWRPSKENTLEENARFSELYKKKFGEQGVPDAPFKTSWPLLAFKRVLRMAAEQGYDAVAWTPGEVQSDRYDLSKQISRAGIQQRRDKKYNLVAEDLNGKPVITQELKDVKNLEDYVGKDVAKRILEAPLSEDGFQWVAGEGLKVGGEGMKAFYDKMLPNIVGKYVKKLDKAAKVETTNLGSETGLSDKLDETKITSDVLLDAAKLAADDEKVQVSEALKEQARDLDLGKPLFFSFAVPGMEVGNYVAKALNLPTRKQIKGKEVWTLPITEKLKESVLSGQTLFQDKADPRGSVTITDEKYLVSLFDGKNLSTIIHETGHIFLKEVLNLINSGQGSEQLQKDYQAIRTWLKLEDGQEINVEHQEQFARGFEAYLREGKAPTVELSGAFARFRRWLTTVYKTAKELDVKLNNQIRSVFDRLIVADAEIQDAAQSAGMVAKTTDEMNALGIIPEDQAYMRRLIKRAKERAENTMVRARRKEYRKNIKLWRENARLEVENLLIYKTIRNLATGDGLDREELISTYGPEIIRKMPHPDIVKAGNKIESALFRMLQQMEVAEHKGQRFFNQLETQSQAVVTGVKSAYPSWYPDQTVAGGAPALMDALRELMSGKTAKTALEKELMRAAVKIAEEIQQEQLSAQEVIAGNADLQAGDKFTQKGRPAEVISNDGDVIVLKFKDGATVEVDAFFDEIIIDGGLRGIDRKIKQPTGTQNLDSAAFVNGYESADEMISALITSVPKAEALKQLVEKAIDNSNQRHKAEDYILNTKEYADYLSILSRYLKGGISQGQGPASANVSAKTISRQAFRSFAKKTLNKMSVREAMRHDRFLAAMKKASDQERRANLANDYGKAAKANEQVRLNYELAGLSVKIRREVDLIIRKASRAGRSATVDLSHRENILALIARFNLAEMAPQKPAEMTPLYKLIAPNDDNYESGFPASDFILNGSEENYKNLSVDQVRELGSLIEFLTATGRAEFRELLSDGQTRIGEAVGEMAATTAEMKTLKANDPLSFFGRMSDNIRAGFAMLDSYPFIVAALGNYKGIGPDGTKTVADQYLKDPLIQAQNEKSVMFNNVMEMVKPHLVQIQRSIQRLEKRFGKRIFLTGVPVPQVMIDNGQTYWTANNIFSIALNMGNEGNIQRLLSGYPELTQASVETLLNLLNKDDWIAVQGVWDTIETLYPQTAAVHKNLNHFHMDKIEAMPFTNRHGSFRGGYYPARFDPRLSLQVATFSEADDLFARSEAIRQVPASKSGSTKTRKAKVSLPLKLDLNVAVEHIRDTVHYITHAEAIKDADRIIRHEYFAAEATRVLGKSVYDMMRPALRHIARPQQFFTEGQEHRAVQWLRGKTTAFILAWNASVAAKQVFSTPGAIHDIGVKAYLKGFGYVLSNPGSNYQTMVELSPYMKDRGQSMDREMQSMFNKMKPGQKQLWFGDESVTFQDVVNFGFWPIKLADTITVLPIWHGAYQKKLQETNGDLRTSVDYADNMVRNSQPSAQPIDLSYWQRAPGIARLLSQFQTFTVGKYGQRQRLHYRAWRAGQMTNKEYAWFNFMDAIIPALGMNFLMASLWGQDVGEGDTWRDILTESVKYWFLTGVPIVNQFFSAYGDMLDSPIGIGLDHLKRSLASTGKYLESLKDGDLEKLFWNLAHFTSYSSGVPVSKVVERVKKGIKQDQENIPGIKFLIPAPKSKIKKTGRKRF